MKQEPFHGATHLLLRGAAALFLLLQSTQFIASEIEVAIHSPSLGTNDYSDIVHRDNQWTIVGNQGTIVNSPDGIHWTRVESGTKLGIRSLAYSSDLCIAVGDQGLILASRDRENWALISSPTINHLNEISYAFGQWMAVGNRGTILASNDGTNWNQIQSSATNADLHSIDFGNKRWVAVGDSAISVYSSDGIQWIDHSLSTTITERHGNVLNLSKISFDGRRWYAIGGGFRPGFAIVLRSEDGIEWNQIPDMLDMLPLNDLAAGSNQRLLMVGLDGTVAAINSQDRRTRLYTINEAKTTINAIAKGPRLWIGVGERGLIAGLNERIPPRTTIKEAAQGKITSMAFGDDTYIATTNGSSLLRSQNGINWHPQPLPTDSGANAVRFNQGLWVAAGPFGIVFTSTNSIDWQAHRSPTTEPLKGIAGKPGHWIAVGENLTIVQTSDFQSWDRSELEIGRRSGPHHLTSIAFNEGTWIAAGRNGNILKSTDGTSWDRVATSHFSKNWNQVKHLDSQWWVIGVEDCCTPAMVHSEDNGKTWQEVELRKPVIGQLFDIASDGEFTLIVGEPRLQEPRTFFGPDRTPSNNLLASTGVVAWWTLQTGVQGSLTSILSSNGRWFAGTDRGSIVELILDSPNPPLEIAPTISQGQEISSTPTLTIRRGRPGYVVISYSALEQVPIQSSLTLAQAFRDIQGTLLPSV